MSTLESNCNYDQMQPTQIKHRKLLKRRDKITFFFVFVFLLFVVEIILRNPLYNLSLMIMHNLNGNAYCNLWDRLAFFELYTGKIFLLLVIINFKNIYAGLIFVSITEFSTFLNGILKLFYLQPRPFWIDTGLTPCSCFVNYGNPSTTAINSIIIFLVFYRCFRKNKKQSNYRVHNIILGILCTFLVLMTCFTRFIQYAHSLNQLFFGFGIGYSLYYLVFEIFEVEVESKEHFRIFIEHFTHKIIFFLLMAHVAANIIHYFLKLDYDQSWLDVLTKYCDYIPFNFFDNESYQKSCSIFLAIAVIFSVYLEYILIFDYDFDKFYYYNVDMKASYKWNDTSIPITIIRLIFSYLTFLYIQSLFLVGDLKTDSFITLIFYRFILLNIFVGLYLFLIVKFILRYVYLTNEKVFLKEEVNLEETENAQKMLKENK
jgi:hypothetical protein